MSQACNASVPEVGTEKSEFGQERPRVYIERPYPKIKKQKKRSREEGKSHESQELRKRKCQGASHLDAGRRSLQRWLLVSITAHHREVQAEVVSYLRLRAHNSTKRFFRCWIEQMKLAFFVYKQPTFPFPKLSSQAVYCKLDGPYIWTALLIGCVDSRRIQKRTVSTSTRTPLKAMGTSTSVLHFLSPFPQLFHCRRPYYERGDTRTIKDWWPFTYGAYRLGAEGRHSLGVLL